MEPKGTVRLLPDKRHGTQHKKLSNEMKENFGATLFRDCLFEATTNDAPSLAPNQDPPEMRRRLPRRPVPRTRACERRASLENPRTRPINGRRAGSFPPARRIVAA